VQDIVSSIHALLGTTEGSLIPITAMPWTSTGGINGADTQREEDCIGESADDPCVHVDWSI